MYVPPAIPNNEGSPKIALHINKVFLVGFLPSFICFLFNVLFPRSRQQSTQACGAKVLATKRTRCGNPLFPYFERDCQILMYPYSRAVLEDLGIFANNFAIKTPVLQSGGIALEEISGSPMTSCRINLDHFVG